MRLLALVAAAASLMPEAVWGFPVEEFDGTGSPGIVVAANAFQLTQVENENYSGPNGLEAMLLVYIKYNKTIPPDLAAAIKMDAEMCVKYKSLLPKSMNIPLYLLRHSVSP